MVVIFNRESNENVSVASGFKFLSEHPTWFCPQIGHTAYPQNCHVNEEYDDLPILTAGFSLFAYIYLLQKTYILGISPGSWGQSLKSS